MEDDFIGTTFPTPEGGVLTVVSDNGLKGNKKRYDLICSICSKDTELFPDKFKSAKSNLVCGQIPCGCVKNYHWSEYQYKIKVQRKCDERGYILHGWAEEFRGRNTILDLENPLTKNRWMSTSIGASMSGQGDPEEGRLRGIKANTIDDDIHIEGFHKAGFTDGFKFTRVIEGIGGGGHPKRWNYTCPICSTDEYVRAGVCSGLFTSYTGNLKKGIKACRCSNYRWTQEQRE